jgi:hypothetical protein
MLTDDKVEPQFSQSSFWVAARYGVDLWGRARTHGIGEKAGRNLKFSDEDC